MMIKPSIQVRFPRAIYEQVRSDLARSHPYAAERIGFLSTALKIYKDGSCLLLVTDYCPVGDSEYIPDDKVGARIGSNAIRTVMQRIIDTQHGSFHVHMHGHNGIPSLSRIDHNELPRLVASLRNANPNLPHGIFLLSNDYCNCWVWLPGNEEPVSPDRITIVGYPFEFINPNSWFGEKIDERFDRQSFLGPQSQAFIESVRIGIVGLGGGGSHIVQQLAHIGVKHFRIFDRDWVDESNLNRLVGAKASDPAAKIYKTQIAKRIISDITPDATIFEYIGDWKEQAEILEQCDLVFGCVDTFSERRALEITCRRYLIPYIDIGMDVHQIGEDPPRMAGQVILSMPGQLCMHCLTFLTEHKLAQEAAKYGNVGGRPQVVWPNGLLASSAVGVAIDLITGWTRRKNEVIFLSYDGNRGTLIPDSRLQYLVDQECSHFPVTDAGPSIWHRLQSE